jgi:hypothetical protein
MVHRVGMVRTGWLTTVVVAVNTALVSRWTVRVLRLGTIVALVGLRRWRHLVVFLGCVVTVELAPRSSLCWSPGHDQLGCGSSAGGRGSRSPARRWRRWRSRWWGWSMRCCRPAGRGPGASGRWAVCCLSWGLPGCTWRSSIQPTCWRRSSWALQSRWSPSASSPQRGLPGHLPARQDRAPGRRWPPRAGHPHRRPGAAGPDRPGRPTGRAGGLSRVHPLRLRIAASDGAPERDLFAKLYAKPRPRRPVPQAGPHDPVRRAGGRGPLPVGPPLCRVRGLHAAAAAPRRHPGAGP